MHNRDLQDVRLVGTLTLLLGVVLFALTGFTALLLLYVGASSNAAGFFKGILGVLLALVMAATLCGLGGQMQHIRTGFAHELENLRLVWTSMVLMMVVCGAAAIWLVPPLFGLAALVLLAMLAIRGAVIRLTT